MADSTKRKNSSPTLRKILLGVVLCALSLGIAPNPEDSTSTEIQLWTGGGQYALIDACNETRKSADFGEFGLSVARAKTDSIGTIRVGLRGTVVDPAEIIEGATTRRYSLMTVNSFIDVETKFFGAGLGLFVATDELPGRSGGPNISPSIRLRLGNPTHLYADGSFLHLTPTHTGGYARLGIGSHFGRDSPLHLWLGKALLPYDKWATTIQLQLKIRPGLYLDAVQQSGRSSGIKETGASLGVTFELD
jgi:hypothetical protein